MAELDLTNIAAASIATPAAGVLAVYSELTGPPAKRLSTKDDAGVVVTLVGLATVDRLTNKDLGDTTTISNVSSASKALAFTLSGMTAAVVLTLSSSQSTSQTLTIPNITGADTIVTTGLAQTVTGVKTLTNPTTAAGTTGVPSYTVTTGGTLMTTPTAGVQEADAAAFYSTLDITNGRRYNDSWNYFRLTGSGTGITTIADFFGTNDGIPLVANGVYEIEWVCYFSQATAGTATWTIVTATTALATLTGEYVGSAVGGIGAVGTPQTAGINVTASSSTAFPVTGTEATAATHYFRIRVLLTAGAGASNTRLRLTMGTGTATPLINSYFRVRRLAGTNVGTFVA